MVLYLLVNYKAKISRKISRKNYICFGEWIVCYFLNKVSTTLLFYIKWIILVLCKLNVSSSIPFKEYLNLLMIASLITLSSRGPNRNTIFAFILLLTLFSNLSIKSSLRVMSAYPICSLMSVFIQSNRLYRITCFFFSTNNSQFLIAKTIFRLGLERICLSSYFKLILPLSTIINLLKA